jgi:hypothetical protein
MSLAMDAEAGQSHPIISSAKPGRGGVQLAEILQALRGRRHGSSKGEKRRSAAAAAAARDSKK